MDLVGQKIGKLTVLQREESLIIKSRIVPRWKVKCECGTVKTVRQPSLRGKKAIRSCGCLLKQVYKTLAEKTRIRNSIEPGLASFNSLYKSYQYRAIKKQIAFTISKTDFRLLTSANCHYCGIEPYKEHKRPNTNGYYIFNGLDRIDSNLGYTTNNIVTCCEICNKAKRNLSTMEFISWVKRISQYQNQK